MSTAGISHCLIDGDFLDMAYPPPWGQNLAERNLAAMWTLGYRRLIYTNTVIVLPEAIERLTTAMGDNPEVVAILLTCTDTTARERLGHREIGTRLDQHLASGADMSARLQASAVEWAHRIPTDARTVKHIAAEVVGRANWLTTCP